MKQTLCCLMQNRLGALDRVLGALTYRGFIPEQFVSTMDLKSDCLQVIVTFECDEEKSVDKLVKFLDKQVYTLEVKRVFTGKQEEPVQFTSQSNIASMFDPVYVKRRLSSVPNS